MEKSELVNSKKVFVESGGVRLPCVDVAKGLGLILVIYGHLLYNGTWGFVNRAIYSFHMPMYFILSGYVAHEKKEDTFSFIKRKAYELLIPAFIFIVLILPYSCGMNIIAIIKEITFWKGTIWNAPVWFLIVLFQVYIIFDMTNLIKKSVLQKIVFVILTFVVGFIIYRYLIWLPFGLPKTVVALGFYMIGNIFKEVEGKFTVRKKQIILIVSCLVWFYTGCILNSKVSMYGFELGNYWYFILSGISGSIVWFGVSYLLRNVKTFQKWGQNTIFVVCTHYMGVAVVTKITDILKINGTIYFDLLALVLSFIAMFVYMPICDWINKNMPILVGRKSSEKCRKLY